jgi:hypothetical protein
MLVFHFNWDKINVDSLYLPRFSVLFIPRQGWAMKRESGAIPELYPQL